MYGKDDLPRWRRNQLNIDGDPGHDGGKHAGHNNNKRREEGADQRQREGTEEYYDQPTIDGVYNAMNMCPAEQIMYQIAESALIANGP